MRQGSINAGVKKAAVSAAFFRGGKKNGGIFYRLILERTLVEKGYKERLKTLQSALYGGQGIFLRKEFYLI